MASVDPSVTLAITNFAFDLFQKLNEADPSGNVFLSPMSISFALAMTYLGARGETADQMGKVARFKDIPDINKGFGWFHTFMNSQDKSYTLDAANQLFGRKDYKFLDAFLGTLLDDYKAEMQRLDFASDPEGSRETINKWVEEKTKDKIKDLLPPGSVNSLTALVLVNAIYFKANWAKQFDKRETMKGKFHVAETVTREVDMMKLKSKFKTGFCRDSGTQVLELPYVNDELSMVILMPNGIGLEKLLSNLTGDFIEKITSNMQEMMIIVQVPRFKFEFGFNLHEVLPSMGMTDLFDMNKADLSGMDGTRDMYISKGFHKAFIEVNEEGTEAAAATAMVSKLRSMPRTFSVDRPFVFMIRHNKTKVILFLGKVVDPGGKPVHGEL